MILGFEENKVEDIEEFAVSLINYNNLEKLTLYLNKNLLAKLPTFSPNGNSNINNNNTNNFITIK